MNTNRFFIYCLTMLLLGGNALFAQPPAVDGIVNEYAQVLDTKDCNDTIIVGDLVDCDLEEGDRVLIIQMKGGVIHPLDEPCCFKDQTPGAIKYYNAAGNFEFATIAAVEPMPPAGSQVRNRVLLESPLKNLYEAGLWGRGTNGVQLVKVPVDGMGDLYEDLQIGASGVTAEPWNDSYSQKGGVVALEITGTLTITGDIDVSGLGYWGGLAAGLSSASSQHSLVERVYAGVSWVQLSGRKGEGIDSVNEYFIAGRGWIANGGGGGNADGAGGGGGGNFGAGGLGGMQASTLDPEIINGGEGGQAIAYSTLGTRAFMGGGGGGGHEGLHTIPPGACSTCTSASGVPGGGIVIIRAAKIIADGGNILADGENGNHSLNAGAGGGGAGGTVLLSVPAFDKTTGNTLTISCKGGVGGNAQQGLLVPANTAPPACFGPGGGGGGGLIWFSNPKPSDVTATVTGGVAGTTVILGGIYACPTPSARGATQGSNGTYWEGLVLPGDPIP